MTFSTKFAQKGCLWSKTEKVNSVIEFCIFKLVSIPNFSLNWQLWGVFCLNLPKKEFPVENGKVALVHSSMVVTYYIKLFCTGADRRNGILMSLLFQVAETIKAYFLLLSYVVLDCNLHKIYTCLLWMILMVFFNSVKEINRLRKEINRLLRKGMSNVYVKLLLRKKWRSENFDFLSLKKLSSGQSFWSSNSPRHHWSLKRLAAN